MRLDLDDELVLISSSAMARDRLRHAATLLRGRPDLVEVVASWLERMAATVITGTVAKPAHFGALALAALLDHERGKAASDADWRQRCRIGR